MIEVKTQPCLGCGDYTFFTMTWEQYTQWKAGVHVQIIFPDWSAEDREMLISGTCPDCWRTMWDEMVEEDDDDFVIDPESDAFNYERDWYVD